MKRHIIVLIFVTINYGICNLFATIEWRAPYKQLNITTTSGAIASLICFAIILVVFLTLEYLTKIKLNRSDTGATIVAVLDSKFFESFNHFKYSNNALTKKDSDVTPKDYP